MPLRWKLVAIYAVVLAIVIGGFSIALVVALRSTLERGIAVEVEALARGLGAVLEFERGAWVIEPQTDIEGQFARGDDEYYRIVDDQGSVLLASPLARTLEFAAARDGERVWQTGGRRFLEVTLPVVKPVDEKQTMRAKVTLGKDLRDVELAVGSLTRLLLWLGPLVLLLSLAGGLFLAGRALRPIHQIARTAAAIGARDLGQRIPVRGRDELASLAATLNSTFARLQQSFDQQERFTADASHELRTPLAVVAGNVELALDRSRGPAELRELLQEIRAATLQMQALLEGLLALARADHGDLGRDLVLLAPLCREALRTEAATARDHGVELCCDGIEELRVRGDAACLQQMLLNLVRNAVRYNRPGGHVVVSARHTDRQARIGVADDGIGIPAAALPHLGTRFYRVDPSRARATGGAGLGLSIAKAIVQAHGGTLQIESIEHEGTRVLVTLPLAED